MCVYICIMCIYVCVCIANIIYIICHNDKYSFINLCIQRTFGFLRVLKYSLKKNGQASYSFPSVTHLKWIVGWDPVSTGRSPPPREHHSNYSLLAFFSMVSKGVPSLEHSKRLNHPLPLNVLTSFSSGQRVLEDILVNFRCWREQQENRRQ